MKKKTPKSPRRGRPPRSLQAADASRGLILDAARTLFAAEGYEGVSMRKLASIAQCSPAALYTLFPSKLHLLRHLWEEIFSALIVRLEKVYAASAASARVEALCNAFIDFWLRRPDDYRAIFLIEDRLQGAQDRYFVNSSETLPRLNVLRRSIAEAQARKELRAGSPDAIQNILLCGIQGIALNLITIPEYPWGNPKKLQQGTIRALVAGLR